ncbi:uncharacterized protein cubi_03466 [Cryptosporidium ubiquitum]|uniref:Uncharacterized protein n=1 Tax=Cryptosporidium ubiquitum TaxID=857276 RepID=A0A1J4MKX0_9CRYT|nr:uncharacterized protein cubi_03466 [Cryptosporidium ubiquitum]OII73668.1 hypothetical protein cubi_03466 [Cryptosporidium ubiquitum]
MFDIFLCCSHSSFNEFSQEEKEEIRIECATEKVWQESSPKETFQNSINDLRRAEREALEIVEKAKKNRREYLRQAEAAAREIIKPYYDLADQEFKEIEISLNKELHIKSLENALDIQKDSDHMDEIELEERKNEVIEYIYSKISDVKLVLENPKFVKSQLERHKISKTHHKKHHIRNKFMSWRSRDDTEKKKKASKSKNKYKKISKEKVISFCVEKNDSSMSTIELDEDYSKIDNLYGASRVVNSFNTIHLN